MRYAMIMAGGAGTRLWPMSRQSRPKQLIPLAEGHSLLEAAAQRIESLIPRERQLICTAERFRGDIRSALPGLRDENILGEPEGRDTVNAIALAAVVLAARDPEAIFTVLTADHRISPEDRFRDTIEKGFDLVESNPARLVTFSIEPTFPATQFGYVQRSEPIAGVEGAFRVERFVEKPPTEKKAKYLIDTGRCAWNSGMFVFSARGFLRALETFKPEIDERMNRIRAAWGTERQGSVLAAEYPKLEKISVDYAIMEPASTSSDFDVCTVLMNVDWHDVGSWPSYAETLDADAAGNRTNTRAVNLESRNILSVSDDPSHTVATIGCEGLMIIHTRDATLICPADQAEKVKNLVERLGEDLR